MELTALAYLEQSPGPSGKGLSTPLPPDIITSEENGPRAGLQATGQLKLCHLSYLTLSLMSASNPHWPWMLEQRGPVGEELRKSPGLHYPGCGPCPHRQAGVSSSSPEWKQLSGSSWSLCTPRTLWDGAVGTLWEASCAVASSSSLMSHLPINQGFRAGFLGCVRVPT